MKINKGFTLIELLAVVSIIALLSLVVVPSAINLMNRNKPKLNDATKKTIYAAAEMYLDANQTNYIKAKGAVYCPTVQELIDSGFLEEKLINLETGEEYAKDLIIQSSYNGYKYNYNILNSDAECNIQIPDTGNPYIVIGNLTYERNGVSKDKVYSNVETIITIPVVTNKIDNGTKLDIKIRRGSSYVDYFIINNDDGVVQNKATTFTITAPKSAKIGEYVIEITSDGKYKGTKNFKIYINPIILFMGD